MKSRSAQLGLITQVESAISLLNLQAICEHGKSEDKTFKFEALVFGSDDFLVSIGMIQYLAAHYFIGVGRLKGDCHSDFVVFWSKLLMANILRRTWFVT